MLGSAQTEARIVEAARSLLAEGGVDACSMRAVAEGSGVTAGAIYRFVTHLPVGNYTYVFSGKDTRGGVATMEERNGPTVSPVTSIPSLDWPGYGDYLYDGLHPEEGGPATTFVFKVTYSHPDNYMPAFGEPRLRVFKGGDEIPGSPFTMVLEVWRGDVGNYTTGAIYGFSIELDRGLYSYRFTASDVTGVDANATLEIRGPDVATVADDDDTAFPGFVTMLGILTLSAVLVTVSRRNG